MAIFIEDPPTPPSDDVSPANPEPNPEANSSDGTVFNIKNFPWAFFELWDNS